MARPVRLTVDLNLAPAEARLRAFEVRVAQATRFGVAGRPSTVAGSVFPLTRRPGAEQIVRRDPVGRIQRTLARPADQTALALSTVGHLAQGSRIAGLTKALQSTIATRPDIARAAGLRPLADIRHEILVRNVLGDVPGSLPIKQTGTLADIARLPRFAQQRMAFAPMARRAGRLSRLHAALSAGSIPTGPIGGVLGKVRSGFEVAGAGGITSRTTVAGLAIAAFAFTRKVSTIRTKLLREAAESGDPNSFSYGGVLKASAMQLGLDSHSIFKSASVMSVTTLLTLIEGAGQIGIMGVGAIAGALPGLDTGSTSFNQTSRDFSNWVGKTVSAADGSVLKQQAIFKGSQDAWGRGFDETVFRAGIFKERIVRARGEQALGLGFNFGSLGDIEDTLAREIGTKIHAAAVNEYDKKNPYPGLKDQTGKKE